MFGCFAFNPSCNLDIFSYTIQSFDKCINALEDEGVEDESKQWDGIMKNAKMSNVDPCFFISICVEFNWAKETEREYDEEEDFGCVEKYKKFAGEKSAAKVS